MTRIRIKICGITDASGVETAVEAGADAVGFVFADSPRQLTPSAAIPLIGMVPPLVSTVAVFRYPTPIDLQRVLGLVQPDLIQTEASSIIFETARNNAWHILPVLHDEPDFEDRLREVETHMTTDGPFVLEGQGRGGRGMKPDWGRASHLARSRRLVLAGGLNAHNVEDAVRRVRPWAVDVSSGVETSPGIKDANRIRAFVDAVRNAERHFNSAPKALT